MDEPEQKQDDRPAERPAPQWVWVALVTFALVAVTAGAIVGMVATEGRGGSAGIVATGGSEGAATGALPPTVEIPPATDFPETDMMPPPTGPIETIPTQTDTLPSGLTEWPQGESGFTVILSSTPESSGQGRAVADAERAIDAGLPSVGILRSSDFSSLSPGWWAVFSGVYSTLEDAQAAVSQARSAGFASAYSRTITP